jgi:hypothetical protein
MESLVALRETIEALIVSRTLGIIIQNQGIRMVGL